MRNNLVLALLLAAVQFALVLGSPNSRVRDWMNACRIDDWTTECAMNVAARRPLRCCTEEPQSRDRVSALMRTMQKHHPPALRVVPATCFGSNVRVYYMPRRDEFLINPVVVDRDTSAVRWYECRGVRRQYATSVTVRFLNSYFNEQTVVFENVDGFALECELE